MEFLKDPYEEEVFSIYHDYCSLYEMNKASYITYKKPYMKKNMLEAQLIKNRVAKAMLLSKRMVIFVDQPDELKKIFSVISSPEDHWLSSLSDNECRLFNEIFQRVFTSNSHILHELSTVFENKDFDFSDYPVVADTAYKVIYHALRQYINSKLAFYDALSKKNPKCTNTD